MGVNRFCKVLIISNNAFSTIKNNGKTLTSLFLNWPKDKIAQLYFYPEKPDYTACSNFLRITDEDIALKPKTQIGINPQIEESPIIKGEKTTRAINIFRKYRNVSFFPFLRNLLWLLGEWKWNNKNLNNWLNDFNPDVVFFVAGGTIFPYKIAQFISGKFCIPLFLYYTDDYFFNPEQHDLFGWINLKWLNNTVRKTLPLVNNIFVIGSDMKNEYENSFGTKCIPIMNSVDITKYSKLHGEKNVQNPAVKNLKLAYFGGLHLNRWESLTILGEAIQFFSKAKSIDMCLDIYSINKPDPPILNLLNNEPHIRFVGSVDEKQIINTFAKYDILVHAESFDPTFRKRTRLSISTKIPEYLATGKPILALGPKEISSIQYLIKNNAAYVINSLNQNDVWIVLEKILDDYSNYREIGKRNINLAKSNHSAQKTREMIKNILGSAVKRC